MSVPCSIALVTVPNSKTADSIAAALLEERLAACVNQVPNVKSSYRWEGRIERAKEALLIVKTRSSLMRRLIECVRKNHPYSVPEIISFPIAEGNPSYLGWIESSTEPPRRSRS